MTKQIEVWLKETSEPIIHQAANTYTKGPFYCVYCWNLVLEVERVFKYPVQNIFRVVEEYGSHGGGGGNKGRA